MQDYISYNYLHFHNTLSWSTTTSIQYYSCSFAYRRLTDAYGCLGVLTVNGGNAAESNFYLVLITGASNVGKVLDVEVSFAVNVDFLNLNECLGSGYFLFHALSNYWTKCQWQLFVVDIRR